MLGAIPLILPNFQSMPTKKEDDIKTNKDEESGIKKDLVP